MNNFKLTDHFTFFELTRTDQAELQELNRRKGLCCMPELKLLSVAVLEPVRTHYDKPVIIHSGFRCPELNMLIGGSKTSQHMLSQAADFHVKGISLDDVFAWLWHGSGIPFGQLIDEQRGGDRWIHASTGGKREVLGFKDGKYARLA
ncbi:MAG TPA: D-Ala-D-Ala carboxypeptidase family metallohydrolase [Elusimicrobiales bacterium]|nr:D-Ala-D-Ala carboxypeptidase family metallohydrolase [Elusimicrobiales bacterium]